MRDYMEEQNDVDLLELAARPLPAKYPRSTMLVSTMAKMLGLHKTESYWLVHKKFFKTMVVGGTMRVDIASFEEWYARQIKYKKVSGPPPGEKLREESYSARDISEMLGISENYAYDVMKDEEFIIVDFWKRWAKDVFDRWYASQTKYRKKEDRQKDNDIERNSMSMPEMAWLLGVPRSTVYTILNNEKNRAVFDIIVLADRKRVMNDSFMKWYESQSHYKMLFDSIEEAKKSKPNHLPHERYLYNDADNPDILEAEPEVESEMLRRSALSKKSTNADFYTIDDVMEILHVKRETVRRKINSDNLPAMKVAGTYRIPKKEFMEWFEIYQLDKEEKNGVDISKR